MKKQITLEDFKQLSKKQYDKLIVWILNNRYPEELTIGHLIEFLDDKGNYLLIDYGGVDLGGEKFKWRVEYVESQYNSNELCNALWDAVKDSLNN